MKYIRSCPTCSMELRFPLDMGILIITCPNCKTSFRMDPDDPKTYHAGSFDLSPSEKKNPLYFSFNNQVRKYFFSKKDIQFLIPIFLFLILLLNLIKIFNTTEVIRQNNPGEKQDFFEEPKPENQIPEDNQSSPKPSVEI